jgi:predicted RNA-binding Zn-ribbon protein involved in translation (DUF1610 family)
VPRVCDHNIRETLKGVGPCQITYEVLKRTGQPNWWCHAHGMAASAPDGQALERCPGAWFDPVPEDQQLDLDVANGELAVWGALPPAIEIGQPPSDGGKVHVHHRSQAGAEKDIDGSFDIVRLRNGDRLLVIEGMAAVAYSVSELANRSVVPLACPWCSEVHIDEQKFATYPHKKHLCNSCGRNFHDRTGPSISNPLARAYDSLGLTAPPVPLRAETPLELDRRTYAGVALWPSNSAIISTMHRPEQVGVHVHAWDDTGRQLLDETYYPVILDGEPLDEKALRLLAIQRALAHDAPIVTVACTTCGTSITSPVGTWMEPTTSHTCQACGASTRTRHRSFLNPLANK